MKNLYPIYLYINLFAIKLPCRKSLSIAHRFHGVRQALRQNTGVAVNPRDLKLNEINDISTHPNKRVLITEDFYQLILIKLMGILIC